MVSRHSSSSTILDPLPASLEGLDPRYEIHDRAAVVAYLDRHPFLLPLLNDASTQIPRYFEPNDLPELQVVQDRESLARQLYLIVRTSLPPETAFDRLDRFDEAWWLDASDAAQGALTIDIEPR